MTLFTHAAIQSQRLISATILTLFFASACTTHSPLPQADRPVSRNAAVIKLMDAVNTHIDNQDYTLAESKIERALRIEPENPFLWHRLAMTAFEQGNFIDAENIAKRGMNYVGNDFMLTKKLKALANNTKK